MKLTEKILLDNYTGISNSGDLISEIPGKGTIYWNYLEYMGFNYGRKSYKCTKFRKNADYIRTFTFGYCDIKLMDIPKRCMNKVANERVQSDIKAWCDSVDRM